MAGELKLMTVDGAREFRLDYLARVDATASDKAQERAELQARMDEIAKELIEIMQKYELD